MHHIAPRIQTATLGSTLTVEATGAVTIFGFIISNADGTNARTVQFLDSSSNDVIGSIYMAAGSNFESTQCWRAESGLLISCDTADADVEITVFRSSSTT
jgi:hypothetical protein